ncbi:unnamed protein product [Aspergillus oryzae var. brunneus]|uniref:Unnamed protein product n=1 Tax=Aspergillus oryzae var. brunneus TaxID=332754 RepID=A0ABQ6KT66_ASPOZ|nr:unnamed protein product [Aspergillus oryzae var. brunneus]
MVPADEVALLRSYANVFNVVGRRVERPSRKPPNSAYDTHHGVLRYSAIVNRGRSILGSNSTDSFAPHEDFAGWVLSKPDNDDVEPFGSEFPSP